MLFASNKTYNPPTLHLHISLSSHLFLLSCFVIHHPVCHFYHGSVEVSSPTNVFLSSAFIRAEHSLAICGGSSWVSTSITIPTHFATGWLLALERDRGTRKILSHYDNLETNIVLPSVRKGTLRNFARCTARQVDQVDPVAIALAIWNQAPAFLRTTPQRKPLQGRSRPWFVLVNLFTHKDSNSNETRVYLPSLILLCELSMHEQASATTTCCC